MRKNQAPNSNTEERHFFRVAFCQGLSYEPSYLIVLADNPKDAEDIIRFLHSAIIPHSNPPERIKIFASSVEDLGLAEYLVPLWKDIDYNEYLKAWDPLKDQTPSEMLEALRKVNPRRYQTLIQATKSLMERVKNPQPLRVSPPSDKPRTIVPKKRRPSPPSLRGAT